ncbi:MAG: hypothetical protein OQK95_01980 [Gammaproteobacteria bacterium]|nr:hypothetical protein [Gammaproteobacteria bacterium]
MAATGLLLVGLSANLSAEEISIPAPKAGPTPSEMTTLEEATSPVEATEYSVKLPGRGMSMEMVQNRFGEALEKYSAVGDPPITKWVYQNFTVYFESEFVIHAVVNR